MLQIQHTLVSLDVIEKKFCCNLAACKGQCCVDGDSGAPLTDEETGLIEEEFHNFREFMRPEGVETVNHHGTWVIDSDHDMVTPLINNRECAYVIFENGIAKCAIEKAFFAGKSSFRKPVSCHLYPVRVKKYKHFTAVNYDIWDICKPAVAFGEEQGIPVYQFLKEALIRRFGKEWHDELELAAENLLKR